MPQRTIRLSEEEGVRLRDYILEGNYTQTTIAHVLGINVCNIKSFLNGTHVVPVSAARRLYKFLGEDIYVAFLSPKDNKTLHNLYDYFWQESYQAHVTKLNNVYVKSSREVKEKILSDLERLAQEAKKLTY